MSALMTWQESPSTYAAPAAATVTSYMQALLAALTSWGGESISRWQVCSSDVVTNPHYITLKRKNGAPGRILFLAQTANFTFQAPLGRGYISSVNQYERAYFPDATSDTPVNFAGGGNIFTNQTRCTGVSSTSSVLVTTHLFKIYDCEDGILILQSALGGYSGQLTFAGDLIEDRDGNALPIAGHDASSTGLAYTIAPANYANNTTFYTACDAVGQFPLHVSAQYNVASGASFKDVSLGEAWFIPIILGHPNRPYGKLHSYKFRQIGFGPATSVANEKLFVSGPILTARNINFSAGGSLPWLTEFFI